MTGYIRYHLRQFSACGSTASKELIKEICAADDPDKDDIFDAYMIWITENDRTDYADALFKEYIISHPDCKGLYERFSAFVRQYDAETLEAALESGAHGFTVGVNRLYRNYRILSRQIYQRQLTVSDLRDEILRIKQEKQITNYRIFKTLGMNPGNINKWLKYGTYGTVSEKTARRILAYVDSYVPPKVL